MKTTDTLKERVFAKIKAKEYNISYSDAIELSNYTEVKYLWNKDKNNNSYLNAIIIKQFDGLIIKVKHNLY